MLRIDLLISKRSNEGEAKRRKDGFRSKRKCSRLCWCDVQHVEVIHRHSQENNIYDGRNGVRSISEGSTDLTTSSGKQLLIVLMYSANGDPSSVLIS
jgi:hypothetical protein